MSADAGGPDDADDAFQATFLVLVRLGYQPAAPRAPWLHRVAHLTARGVRRRNARRLARTSPLPVDVPARPDPPPVELDRTLLRLPEKYRSAVVLCCLQGLTEREAAEQLGCPVGTLSARVSRGLARVRKYTAAPLVVAAVPTATAVAAVRVAVVVRTASQVTGVVPAAVSSLAQRVSRMLWLGKAIRATLAMIVAVGGLALASAAGGPPPAPLTPKRPPDEKPPPAKPAEPDWRAEFQKAFGLKDGEVLKPVHPPHPAPREKWFAAYIGDAI